MQNKWLAVFIGFAVGLFAIAAMVLAVWLTIYF